MGIQVLQWPVAHAVRNLEDFRVTASSRRAICEPPYCTHVRFYSSSRRDARGIARHKRDAFWYSIRDGGIAYFAEARNKSTRANQTRRRTQKAWLWMQRATRLIGNSRIPRHPDTRVRTYIRTFPILRQPRLALHLVTLYHAAHSPCPRPRRIPPDDSRKLCWKTSCLRNRANAFAAPPSIVFFVFVYGKSNVRRRRCCVPAEFSFLNVMTRMQRNATGDSVNRNIFRIQNMTRRQPERRSATWRCHERNEILLVRKDRGKSREWHANTNALSEIKNSCKIMGQPEINFYRDVEWIMSSSCELNSLLIYNDSTIKSIYSKFARFNKKNFK